MQQNYIKCVWLQDRTLLKKEVCLIAMPTANTQTTEKYQNSKSIRVSDVDFILKRLHSFVDSYLQ